MSFAVVRARGLVTVQDLGRPGRMHEAMPPGGALVPARLIAANRAVQNPDGAAALEVLGELAIRAERACIVATDAAPARALAAGAELVIASEPRRVTYLALRGGLDAPLVLGGRGALLCAGLGGLVKPGERFHAAGLRAVRPPDEPRAHRAPALTAPASDERHLARPSQAGGAAEAVRSPDARGVGDPARPARATPVRSPDDPLGRWGAGLAWAGEDPDEPDDDVPEIRLVAGPDPAAFLPTALALLGSAPYRILPSSNRVGTRLAGPALPRSAGPEVSRPMVLGAIEVPGDGQPIVLGPEHPTTGGYPVIAVVARADLGTLFSIRLGGSVRFRIG